MIHATAPVTFIGDFSDAVWQIGDPVKVVIAATFVGQDHVVLLQRHPEQGQTEGVWTFPSGKVKAGETELDAVRRELEEETGVGHVMMFERLEEVERVSPKGEPMRLVYCWVRIPHVFGKMLQQLVENREPDKHQSVRVMSMSEVVALQRKGVQFHSSVLSHLWLSLDYHKAADRGLPIVAAGL